MKKGYRDGEGAYYSADGEIQVGRYLNGKAIGTFAKLDSGYVTQLKYN